MPTYQASESSGRSRPKSRSSRNKRRRAARRRKQAAARAAEDAEAQLTLQNRSALAHSADSAALRGFKPRPFNRQNVAKYLRRVRRHIERQRESIPKRLKYKPEVKPDTRIKGPWLENEPQKSEDVALVEQALDRRWPIKPEIKEALMLRIVNQGLTTEDAKIMIRCGEFVLKAEAQNQRDDLSDRDDGPDTAIQNNVQIYLPDNGRGVVG